MITASGNPEPLFYRFITIMLVLFCLWLILPTHNTEMEVAKHLPPWVAWTNLLCLPFLLAAAAGPSHISLPIRSLFLALVFCSLLMLEVTFRRYPWPSATVLVLFLLEVYWIIPKWNSQHSDRSQHAK
jgi:hypothetical protein